MIINKEEEKLILEYRRKIKETQELKIKQQNCKHRYASSFGHGHNHDWYICKDCGLHIEDK